MLSLLINKQQKLKRIELLKNVITEYEARYDDFVQTISKEMGSPIWLSEAAQAKTGIKNIQKLWMH